MNEPPAAFAASPSRSGARVAGWIAQAAGGGGVAADHGARAAGCTDWRATPRRSPPRCLAGSARLAVPKPEDAARTLFAFYDLQVSPITFDFLWFLVGADLERRRRGLEAVHVVIVPGRAGGVRREREDYEDVVDAEARAQRISNILLPACALLPTLRRRHPRRVAQRMQASSAPRWPPTSIPPPMSRRYRSLPARANASRTQGPTCPAYPACGRPTRTCATSTDGRRATAAGRRIVTITLRNYAYMPARNSNMPAWIAFARSLDAARFMPVFVPDLEQTLNGQMQELQGHTVLGEAAWNLGLRMALYERAYISMGVNTGPMGLCWLNARTHYATLKMAPADVPQTTSRLLSASLALSRDARCRSPRRRRSWSGRTIRWRPSNAPSPASPHASTTARVA